MGLQNDIPNDEFSEEVVDTPTDGEQDVPKPVRLSQKQLNDRIAQAKRSRENEVLTALGFDNLDAAKAAIEKIKSVPQDDPTPQAPVVAPITEDTIQEKINAALAAFQATVKEEQNKTRREQVLVSSVTDKLKDRVHSVEDALLLAKQDTNFENILDVNGEVLAETLEAVLKNLEQDKPYLFKSGRDSVNPSLQGIPAFSSKAQADKAAEETGREFTRSII